MLRMHFAGRLWAPILAALLVWASPGWGATDRFRIVRALIQEEIDGGQVPSLAVAVARRGEIVWEEAFGWADRERGIPATPHTMFSLASVSKPLTATGLMVLVERGTVDLDRPVNEYLGEVRLRARVGDPAGATVRQVASHTSGLPLHHHFFADPTRRPPLAETIRRYGNLVMEPGERFQYSNLGYAVLEHLIEQASGKDFARFMREEVFVPLDLEHTAILQEPRASPGLAVRYAPDGQPLPFYGSDHGGGSAAFSCAHDLARFALFHLRARSADRILSDVAIRAMQEPSSQRTDESSLYGIGWTIIPNPGGYDVVRHDGGMPGATATLLLLPAEGIAVAVLCGTRSDLPQQVAGKILDTLRPLGRRLDLAGRRVSGKGRKRSPRRFVGRWAGHVDLGEERVPITLTVERPKALWAEIRGSSASQKLWGVTFRDGYLTGWTRGHLEAEGKESPAPILRLSLKLREDRLNGAMTVLTRSAEGLPGALSHWVDLKRSADVPRPPETTDPGQKSRWRDVAPAARTASTLW